MQSVHSGAQLVAAGRAQLVLAGGTEAMSHAPLVLSTEAAGWLGRWQNSSATERARLLTDLRPELFVPEVGLLQGLTDPYCGLSMGQTAEILAHRFGISRADADDLALESHRRLAAAIEEDRLGEITPVFDKDGTSYDVDTGLRADSTREDLERLSPVFEPPYGQVTAGNSAQVTDGASWVLLASGQACKRHHLEPLGRILDTQWAALAPEMMGLGPVFATSALLARQGLLLKDVELWEINEAFAAQVLACLDAWSDPDFCQGALGLAAAPGAPDRDRINIDGGAIALGHPVGASGNRIVLHLLHALRNHGFKRGIATECVGGGQDGAMLLEVI
jgi:acetyl-CoA C-acetyltransferase